MEMWTLFAIQGHWVTVLLLMYFRAGRAERAKHPWEFHLAHRSSEISPGCLDWR